MMIMTMISYLAIHDLQIPLLAENNLFFIKAAVYPDYSKEKHRVVSSFDILST